MILLCGLPDDNHSNHSFSLNINIPFLQKLIEKWPVTFSCVMLIWAGQGLFIFFYHSVTGDTLPAWMPISWFCWGTAFMFVFGTYALLKHE